LARLFGICRHSTKETVEEIFGTLNPDDGFGEVVLIDTGGTFIGVHRQGRLKRPVMVARSLRHAKRKTSTPGEEVNDPKLSLPKLKVWTLRQPKRMLLILVQPRHVLTLQARQDSVRASGSSWTCVGL
jgi:hypothetical protein